MTTRIDARFAELKREGGSAFITFLMAGDPDPATSLEIIKALPKAGSDIIEIGMPFTDPMADGPAIQAAGLRALKAGMTLKKTLDMVRAFRKGDATTPLVLMGYYNPIYIYGVDKFLADAKSAGVDGLIIVDLPPEADTELCLPAMKAGLNFIRLATPTTDDKRLPAGLANTAGFVYYVSITGIAGSACADSNLLGQALACIKRDTHPARALVVPMRIQPHLVASYELAHQRRPAEDPQHPAPRNTGEDVDQVPGFRAARVLQGRRGQAVRDSRLELPHAHGRGSAAEMDLRQRDLVRHRAAGRVRRSAEIPRPAQICRPHQGCPRKNRPERCHQGRLGQARRRRRRRRGAGFRFHGRLARHGRGRSDRARA